MKKSLKKVIGLIVGVLAIGVIAISVTSMKKGSASISIIGGADGPTSVFVAGKIGTGFTTFGIVCGVVLLIAAIWLVVWKKK